MLADPEGSILTHYVKTGEVSEDVGSWLVEGIGEDFIPDIADLSRVGHAYTISDGEAFRAARELLRKEGILAGSSSGTLLAAALRFAREQTEPKTIVSIVCDSGNKYLSKMFNDFWMLDNGLLDVPLNGDLTDLIVRKHTEKQTITISATMPLIQAYRQMKLHDISQLPVVQDGVLVGILDEEDLLTRVLEQGGQFEGTVSDAMTGNLIKVQATDSLDDVLKLIERGMVAPVMRGDVFEGLITKIDILNHLRLDAQRKR